MTANEGFMPPRAVAAGKHVASGTVIIPQVATLALPTDGAAVGICEMASELSIPRVLTIGFPTAGVFVNGPFPPYPFIGEATPKCGMCSQSGAPFDISALHLACILEYGAGASSKKVWFDWCEGTYNLPPCTFVRVSALPWGVGWPLQTYPANASISEGALQGAHPPTVTTKGFLTAASPLSFFPPGGARAVDISWAGSTLEAAPKLTISGSINAVKDYAAGSFQPGTAPLPTYPGSEDAFQVATSSDATVELKFYLAL